MYYAYLLQSINHPKQFYKGHCEKLSERLAQHNALKTKSNKAFAPYKILHHEEFSTRDEAIAREKYFKSGAGRRYLQALIKNGCVVQWIE